MDATPGLLIAAARRRIKQAVSERIAGYPLTSQQFWMIIAILEAPGISQVEIAARTRADAPSTSRALTPLVERGVVRTETDREDRRRTLVQLTAAGRRLARELAPIARDLRAAMVAGMTPAEVAALCALLRRVIGNLDALGDRAPPA